MSEESKTTQQPESSPTPGENGGEPGKTFTQEDVNRIVSERLARERDKAALERAKEDPTEQREKALAAREAAMSCREYISGKGYPAALADILDTADADKFKSQVDKLVELFPEIDPAVAAKTPKFTRSTTGRPGGFGDPIAEAFRPKN